ncbi:hypothetical protein CMP1-59 [Clavibacter phage CMP1]|uniref:Uncharacterized protein n=1 Tax=Clavibacter phage CMP1 TaxID=686439 RepID=D0U243_9CAUD|nr:hypothetical protein CMP1-59 [Clavibacter phage CMP1]ACY35969.1 hypothetical protein CMP1-59 [Clavibacter phage CMP1]
MLEPVEPHIDPSNIEFSAIPETKSIRLGSGIPTIQREVACASGIHKWETVNLGLFKCKLCKETKDFL